MGAVIRHLMFIGVKLVWTSRVGVCHIAARVRQEVIRLATWAGIRCIKSR